jgi:hypothetical protein
MDARRQAFLDDIETDLTAMTSNTLAESSRPAAPGRASSGLARKIAAVTVVLAGGASLLTLSATAATASPIAAAAIQGGDPNCFNPNPVNHDHEKYCGSGATIFFKYLTSYSHGPGGQGTCFVFGRTYFGCGGGSAIPDATVCD